jgi:hypothetical protein
MTALMKLSTSIFLILLFDLNHALKIGHQIPKFNALHQIQQKSI